MTVKEQIPSESHFTPSYTRYTISLQPELEEKYNKDIWWNYPEPIFNMYYYSMFDELRTIYTDIVINRFNKLLRMK